jgi:hypothetical protein
VKKHVGILEDVDLVNTAKLFDTTESRPDGGVLRYETELIFEERDGRTLMTMIHRGLPTAELREEHQAGVPDAFTRLERVIEESP